MKNIFFCDIVNVFTVIFDKLNASCWIKIITFFKTSYWPKPFQQYTVSAFLETIRSHDRLIKSINWWTKCFESDWLLSKCSTELALIWTTKEKCLLNRNETWDSLMIDVQGPMWSGALHVIYCSFVQRWNCTQNQKVSSFSGIWFLNCTTGYLRSNWSCHTENVIQCKNKKTCCFEQLWTSLT